MTTDRPRPDSDSSSMYGYESGSSVFRPAAEWDKAQAEKKAKGEAAEAPAVNGDAPAPKL